MCVFFEKCKSYLFPELFNKLIENVLMTFEKTCLKIIIIMSKKVRWSENYSDMSNIDGFFFF